MNTQQTPARMKQTRAFTLLELIVSMMVMSVIAVVITPIIMSSTDAYAVSRDTRAGTDRVIYALERAARVVRQAPFAADESGLDVQSATASQFIFADGSGFRLSGSQLELLKPGGGSSVLCMDVDRIQLAYFDAAGNPMSLVAPAQIHRVGLQISSGPVTLEMYAMPRAWIGRGG